MKSKSFLFKTIKIVISIVLIVLTFNACKDNENYYVKQQRLLAEEQAKLDQYIIDKNITTLPKASGLYYIETLKGTGEKASYGRHIYVNYEGRYLNDTVFDASKAGEPFDFVVGYGEVIAGWDEAVQYMYDGGKATLIVPSTLGYGAGYGSIPPYTTLIFDIEITNVQ